MSSTKTIGPKLEVNAYNGTREPAGLRFTGIDAECGRCDLIKPAHLFQGGGCRLRCPRCGEREKIKLR